MNNFRIKAAGTVFGLALIASPAMVSADTIVDIAVSDPSNFSSLVDAVVSQDLAGTLSSEGPFTVFAPTNDAFKKLPGFVGNALAEKPELLTDILLYHVVEGDLDSSEVLDSTTIQTVGGGDIMPNTKGNGTKPYVNDSKIVIPDIEASNGTIHVIDRVLLPESIVKNAFMKELNRIKDILESLKNQIN
jgi:uncharacterized surface protein with fasciclin (FAS1) repeats